MARSIGHTYKDSRNRRTSVLSKSRSIRPNCTSFASSQNTAAEIDHDSPTRSSLSRGRRSLLVMERTMWVSRFRIPPNACRKDVAVYFHFVAQAAVQNS